MCRTGSLLYGRESCFAETHQKSFFGKSFFAHEPSKPGSSPKWGLWVYVGNYIKHLTIRIQQRLATYIRNHTARVTCRRNNFPACFLVLELILVLEALKVLIGYKPGLAYSPLTERYCLVPSRRKGNCILGDIRCFASLVAATLAFAAPVADFYYSALRALLD